MLKMWGEKKPQTKTKNTLDVKIYEIQVSQAVPRDTTEGAENGTI